MSYFAGYTRLSDGSSSSNAGVGSSSSASWAKKASAIFTTGFVLSALVFSVFPAADFLGPTPGSATGLTVGLGRHGPTPPLHPRRQTDVTLSHDECRAEFPLLFDQLDANAKVWSARQGVTEDDLEQSIKSCQIGCVRMLVQDGRIFIRNYSQGMQSRIRGIMALFKTAVEAADPLDKEAFEGIDVVFNAFDKNGFGAGRGSGWVLTKLASDAPGQYLLPDFSFAAWPEAGIASYDEFRRDAASINAVTPWHLKRDRAFFRGDPNVGSSGSPARFDLMKQIKKPGAEAWADVARTSFYEHGGDVAPFVSIVDHCKQKYLLHSEGASYSGRSKFVLGCASAVITHDLQWTQHFHPAINSEPGHPNQNIIVSPGHYFENLAPLMMNLSQADAASSRAKSSAPPSLGQVVASNANRTLTNRYLTPAATMCYTRGALISYASALNKTSFANGKGPRVVPGGGVVPNSGVKSVHELKPLLHGDLALTTWQLLDHPEWPPRR